MADAALNGIAVRPEPAGVVHVLRLRRPDDAVLAAVGDALGTALPMQPNTVADGAVRVLWIGPGEWMLLGAPAALSALDAAIAAAPVGHLADIGEGLAVFVVSGPLAADLLAKGSTLDFHPSVFEPMRCAQTALAQTFVTIDRPAADASAFRLFVDRAFAGHLTRWFDDALIEFLHPGER